MAGFRTYAAATTVDSVENERALAAEGKLLLPVLGIGGEASLGAVMGAVLAEIATDVRTVSIAGAGHFLPEEQPAAVAGLLRSFIAEHSG